MSIGLYGIRIQKVEAKQRRLYLKVLVIDYEPTHRTHMPLPNDHSFFLRVLWDTGHQLKGESTPITNDISEEQISSDEWVNNNTYRFIKSSTLEELYNPTITDYLWSILEEYYVVKNGKWKHENHLLQADFMIYVAHKKYLSHLKKGMTWNTTAYEAKAKHWLELQREKELKKSKKGQDKIE